MSSETTGYLVVRFSDSTTLGGINTIAEILREQGDVIEQTMEGIVAAFVPEEGAPPEQAVASLTEDISAVRQQIEATGEDVTLNWPLIASPEEQAIIAGELRVKGTSVYVGGDVVAKFVREALIELHEEGKTHARVTISTVSHEIPTI